MVVRVSNLNNGVTVVTDAMPNLESAALGVWVGVGSRSELPNEHGISHFLEHMAFKGTKHRSARQIAEEIEAVGGELNAATSVENTAYYARVLKSDVPLAIDILSDILIESVFDAGELSREQHVVLQEIGAAFDTPEDRVFDLFQSTAFPDQPIGRSILGTKQTVSGFDPQTLKDYLAKHYRGGRMVVAASGAVDHDEMVARTADRLAAIGGGLPPATAHSNYLGGDRREHRDLMEVQIMLGFRGRGYSTGEHYKAQMLASVLGGGMSSRLFQEVREKRGLCYSVYAFHWAFSDCGVFGIHAATEPADIEELMPVVTAELGRVSTDLADGELERSKAQMRAGLLMALESPSARAGQIARQILIHGRPLDRAEIVKKIDAISAQDIRAMAGDIFTDSPPTLAAVGPVDGLATAGEIADGLGAPKP